MQAVGSLDIISQGSVHIVPPHRANFDYANFFPLCRLFPGAFGLSVLQAAFPGNYEPGGAGVCIVQESVLAAYGLEAAFAEQVADCHRVMDRLPDILLEA